MIVAQNENTLSIYGLNPVHELEKLWTLTPEFQPFRYSEVDDLTGETLYIPHVNDIVPSPDGCYIAVVTAETPNRGFGNRQLFIYSVLDSNIQQIDLEPQIDFLSPNLLWSPESQHLAIAIDGEHSGDIYVYSVSDAVTTRFASTEQDAFSTYFQWLDKETLAFIQRETGENSTYIETIHVRSLDEMLNQQLITLSEHAFPALLTWNAQAQRLFYSTGYLNSDNSVYSIDLEGNHRLELELTGSPSDETSDGRAARKNMVTGIVANEKSGDTYIFTNLNHVFQISFEGDVSTLLEATAATLAMNDASIATSGDSLAILRLHTQTDRQVDVMSLTTSQIEPNPILTGNICSFFQLTDTQLLYTAGASTCLHEKVHDLYLFDASTKSTVNLTDHLDETVWLLTHLTPNKSWVSEQLSWLPDSD